MYTLCANVPGAGPCIPRAADIRTVHLRGPARRDISVGGAPRGSTASRFRGSVRRSNFESRGLDTLIRRQPRQWVLCWISPKHLHIEGGVSEARSLGPLIEVDLCARTRGPG